MIGLNLQANYCIQVITTDTSMENFIIKRASSEEYSPFSDVRVERIGNYLVLRIGDYKSYRHASSVARQVQKTEPGAYVRKCNFTRANALYLHNNSQDDNNYYRNNNYRNNNEQRQKYTTPSYPSYNKPEPNINIIERRNTRRSTRRNIDTNRQNRYKKDKEELSYKHIDRDNSLWNDCKKCFIPVYEEEDDTQQKQPKQQRRQQVKTDTFWEEDIPDLHEDTIQQQTTPPKQKRKKPRNKFNIDEQFLP